MRTENSVISSMNDKPPLPNIQTIPPALVDQWVQIASSEKLELTATKSDIDSLFFSINNLIQSHNDLQESPIAYSNGNIQEANKHMDLSKRASVESLNSLRAFLTSIISGELHARAAKK